MAGSWEEPKEGCNIGKYAEPTHLAHVQLNPRRNQKGGEEMSGDQRHTYKLLVGAAKEHSEGGIRRETLNRKERLNRKHQTGRKAV